MSYGGRSLVVPIAYYGATGRDNGTHGLVFLLLAIEMSFKNLQNCIKVQCCKKCVKKVKKTCFFRKFGFAAKYTLLWGKP